MKWYPIKFTPILQEKIWGGTKLNSFFNKPSTLDNIGESWEISAVKNNISVVANGSLKGKTLQELLENLKDKLVGKSVYEVFKNEFPLLIKFIDANDDLSVQLHPNDILAKKRHDSFGKTEMWYIMHADKGSRLILGFKDGVTKATYETALQDKKLLETLNEVPVKKGDTYFLPTGTVHAIGSGILLAEVQQTSDVTYRVYDWDRVDENGNERDLHVAEALEAINFDYKGEKSNYKIKTGESVPMVNCNYFTTNILALTKKKRMEYAHIDSFVIYMCVSGSAKLVGLDFKVEIKMGETVLIPAALNDFIIKTKGVKLLEVFI